MMNRHSTKFAGTIDLIRDSFDRQCATYRVKLKDCRDDFSEKAVHDLRSCIRRLQATVEIARYLVSHAGTQKLSESFDEQLNGFNELRDTQVMLEEVADKIDLQPGLEPFQKYLKHREKDLSSKAEGFVDDLKLGKVNRRLLKIREKLTTASNGQVQEKILRSVDDAYRVVMQRYWEVDPEQTQSIHHLRVAFKKFRYMVEDIRPALQSFPESLFGRMHDYQTLIGRVQDKRVFLAALRDFADPTASYNPLPVRRYYEESLAETLSTYLAKKDEILDFWRATPLSEFPWQAEQIEGEEKV